MKTLKIEKADNGYILHYEDTTGGENKTFIATTDNINEQIEEIKYTQHNYKQLKRHLFQDKIKDAIIHRIPVLQHKKQR